MLSLLLNPSLASSITNLPHLLLPVLSTLWTQLICSAPNYFAIFILKLIFLSPLGGLLAVLRLPRYADLLPRLSFLRGRFKFQSH